jgi:hypothetical protein
VKWCPPSELQGGSWGKAFKGDTNLLRFKCGSTIQFKTYKQDPSTLGGAGLHWVGYDEPPPKKHREECMWRLGDFGGFEMFAMTPLDTNTGYVRREIYKKRESPDITVVQGSVHDNPTLDKATVARAIGSTSDIYRAAREFGTFVNVGGLIYPEFERCVEQGAVRREVCPDARCGRRDRPGHPERGIVWVGFDRDNIAYVFAERLLQDKVPEGLRGRDPRGERPLGHQGRALYVVDPAARSRGQTNAETVQQALLQSGVYCVGRARTTCRRASGSYGPGWRTAVLGQPRSAAVFAMRRTSTRRRSPRRARTTRHMEVVKSNDHRFDALRYAVMERFWDPVFEMNKPQQALGWSNTTPPKSLLLGRRPGNFGPIGSY